MTAAEKAIEDADQEVHKQSQASDGTNTKALKTLSQRKPRMLHSQESTVRAYQECVDPTGRQQQQRPGAVFTTRRPS